jgi:hypothetical protein
VGSYIGTLSDGKTSYVIKNDFKLGKADRKMSI